MKRFAIVACALLLTACSTTKIGTTEMPKQQQPAQIKTADQVDVPDWYVNLPQSDNLIYAAGTEVSSDLQLAIDKATMSAKREIAFKLNNEINQKIREAASETNYSRGDQSSKQFERLVVATSNANLVGARRVKSEIRREGNRYRAYVMLQFDPENVVVQSIESVKRRKSTDQRLDDYEKQLRRDKGMDEPVVDASEPKKPAVDGNMNLLNVDNEDYKKRRDAALQKPGAVLGQVTVR